MKKAILHSAHFQLTHRCNLECVFCGQSKGLLASEELEMAPAEWIRVASQLKKEAEKISTSRKDSIVRKLQEFGPCND